MDYFVSRDFMDTYGRDLFAHNAALHVMEDRDVIDAALGWRGPYGLFVLEPLDRVLDRLRSANSEDFRTLVAGEQNPRILRESDPTSPDLRTLDAMLESEHLVRVYTDKTDALGKFEAYLEEKEVQAIFRKGILLATDECLLNAIFDAHPVLERLERSSSFELDVPIRFSWGFHVGLLVTRVLDPHGRFEHQSFVSSILSRFLGEGPSPGDQGLSAGLQIMLRHSNALVVRVKAGLSTTVYMLSDTTVRYSSFLKSGRVLVFLNDASDTADVRTDRNAADRGLTGGGERRS